MSWLSKLIDDNYDEIVRVVDARLEKMGLEEFPDDIISADSMDILANKVEADSMELIVDDYYHLINNICNGNAPKSIELSHDNYLEVKIDGNSYDLDEEFEHNDTVNTERRMELEALLCEELSVEEIQTMLNKRFRI